MSLQARSLAERLEAILREHILAGTYAPGSRLPSESELAEEFGVSRATVRTVLARLAAQGLILRRHGEGTYVNARAQGAHAFFGHTWDFVHLIQSNGYEPAIRLMAREIRAATEEEAHALAIPLGEALLSLYRMFYAAQTPVILANNLFPLRLFRVSPDSLDGALHIRDLLRQACGCEIVFAITEIHAVPLPDEAAEPLERRAGEPILALDIAFYGQQSEPLSIGRSFYDDTRLRLNLVQAWR
ncbi:MAG TPA: GntR family transcriptional regulator [Anaerolineae bacterium]|nr:GntR family transcriptional regulator [Anaerolineae bacterium]HID84670.1 GntR family transcriptional regulator [Anaerolineales bacterium]HIQ09885.1 GntR family transcriptional regulator [Anaerolineaceae bacterium]